MLRTITRPDARALYANERALTRRRVAGDLFDDYDKNRHTGALLVSVNRVHARACTRSH